MELILFSLPLIYSYMFTGLANAKLPGFPDLSQASRHAACHLWLSSRSPTATDMALSELKSFVAILPEGTATQISSKNLKADQDSDSSRLDQLRARLRDISDWSNEPNRQIFALKITGHDAIQRYYADFRRTEARFEDFVLGNPAEKRRVLMPYYTGNAALLMVTIVLPIYYVSLPLPVFEVSAAFTATGLLFAGPINANRRWLMRDSYELQFRDSIKNILSLSNNDLTNQWLVYSNSYTLRKSLARELVASGHNPNDLTSAYENAAVIESMNLFGRDLIRLIWSKSAELSEANVIVDRILRYNAHESEPELLLIVRLE